LGAVCGEDYSAAAVRRARPLLSRRDRGAKKFLSVATTFRARAGRLYRRLDGRIGQPSDHQATVNQAKFLRGERMTLAIGDTAPDFEANTTEGRIRFHDWIGNSWAVLFSHPKDFTPICTTELGYMAKIKPEFDKRGVKIIGLSVDPVDNHAKWAEDIKETQGYAPNYPMIGDTDFNVSKLYGMLPAAVSGDPSKRTAADNQTVRNVFVIGPDKKIKLILVYPMTTGRNFDEVLRVIDSLQLTAKHKVATPVNWKQGEDVVIAGSVSDEDAKKQYPAGWKAPRPYLRIVAQPK
jgi:alkyl hydroperoxide reductase subunit AhpC